MTAAARQPSALGRFFSIENRYLAPMLITSILLVSQLSFGLLESFSRTALAISTSILFELVLGRLFWGRFPNLASAYITGISVGILIRSPDFWPYLFCSAIAITSKYVLRCRHLWNPSNFAIAAILILAPETVAILSIQWGNNVWPMLIIWVLGAAIVYRVRRFHITLTYLLSFISLAAVRCAITGDPFLAEVSPITGPMYQLFIFFFLHGHRSENDRQLTKVAGHRRFSGGGRGNGPTARASGERTVLRAGSGRARRDGCRNRPRRRFGPNRNAPERSRQGYELTVIRSI